MTPLFQVPVPIMADEKADPEKGTGVVMVCTFGDQTDVEWWRQFNLPTRQIIGRDGHLLPVQFVPVQGGAGHEAHITHLEDGRDLALAYGSGRTIPSLNPELANSVYRELQGKYTKQAQKLFIAAAEQAESILDRPSSPISHSVKYFEKGDRPLELVPTRQWYTRLMDKKDALIAQGRKIAWHPDYMVKRYEHWVEGLNQDWCLSRQRYFGVPIPVWYKIDEHGGVQYQQRILPPREALPVDPLADTPAGYTEAQRDQPGGFTGEPDVFDTWATSSLSPQVATKWYLEPERHAKLFPMDMRPQAHDIIRTWAFYTIVKAYLHDREIPWKNVVLSGWILDPDRKKMSKSQGNVVTPEPLIDEFGADSVRYWAARARLGVDTAYDENAFKVGKRLCTKLFNASKFALGRFADIDASVLGPDKVTAEADRAVIAELRPLLERVTQAFNEFDYAQALQLTEEFFWRTFCDNYLELAKSRTYEETLTEGRLSAASTLRLLHRTLVRLLAPFLPFLTEDIWGWAYSSDADMNPSIHRSPWPSIQEFASIPAPRNGDTWEATIAVVDAVRKAKADANKSMKAPVKHVGVTAERAIIDSLQCTREDIIGMLHIEAMEYSEGKPETGLAAISATMGE